MLDLQDVRELLGAFSRTDCASFREDDQSERGLDCRWDGDTLRSTVRRLLEMIDEKEGTMPVRAKFKLSRYETSLSWQDASKELRTLVFNAVSDDSPENKEFFSATPNGELKMGVLNKAAWEQFELGKSYYLDFTPAD